MFLVGTQGRHNTVNNKHVVRIHLFFGQLAAHGLAKQGRGNKGPPFVRAYAARNDRFRFAYSRMPRNPTTWFPSRLNTSPRKSTNSPSSSRVKRNVLRSSESRSI